MAGVQIFRKEFYKHIRLDYAKLKILSRIKKLIALPIYGHFCSTDQVIIFIKVFLIMSLLITMTSPCTADVTKLFNY